MPQNPELPDINSSKVTERINATALKLLDTNPEGLSWTDLKTKIEKSDPKFHPKTVNGCGLETRREIPRPGLQASQRSIPPPETQVGLSQAPAQQSSSTARGGSTGGGLFSPSACGGSTGDEVAGEGGPCPPTALDLSAQGTAPPTSALLRRAHHQTPKFPTDPPRTGREPHTSLPLNCREQFVQLLVALDHTCLHPAGHEGVAVGEGVDERRAHQPGPSPRQLLETELVE